MDCMEGLKQLKNESVDTCVTSPPYWGLRDYGIEGQLGLEDSLDKYIENMVKVFREVRRVLKPEGTLWLNLGDGYVGGGNNRGNTKKISSKQASNKGATGQCAFHAKNMRKVGSLLPKQLMGIPWRVALALQDDGWYLRSDIIWNKPNAMPESVKDRPTKSHEYIFLLSKGPRYYYDFKAIKEPCVNGDANPPRGSKGVLGQKNLGRRIKHNKTEPLATRNKRSVWTVPTAQFREAHFATFPPKLIEPCILAGCPVGGVVLDPFMGSGTTAMVAVQNKRNYIGFELNPEYIEMAEKHRLNAVQLKII